MSAAAVFDLDGTLVRGTSAERLLVPFLVRRGVVGVRQLTAALALAATLPVAGRIRALRRNKLWLAGVEAAAVLDELDAFVAGVLERRWRAAVVARLERLRADGHRIHLLTGAPDFIARAVGTRWGMDSVVGTPMEIEDGRFTGRLEGPHRFAEAKRDALVELARGQGLDLARSHGFADHASDVAFLECFGHAVAVAPDHRLRRVAERRGWEVLAGA
ncbi:MAG TPA: HAD-IB family hydrolase [Longimicrobiales bacterium]|nr:HAD-IB family hydrolase [Longimicrobiales bacterium]